MRRMDAEIQAINNPKFNPFKALNRDKGYNVICDFSSKDASGTLYEGEKDNPERVFIGYAAALSTFGRLRGADLSDVGTYVFDEFIRNKQQRPLAGEADAFFNSYETISRNRELQGRQPLKCYLLSNSTSIDTPILAELGLVQTIEHMQKDGQQYFTDRTRGIHIELLSGLQVSKDKEDTALYRLTKGTKYYNHAIDNEFAYDSFENVKKMALMEFIGYIRIGNIYVYRHKSDGTIYASAKPTHCPHNYDGDSIPLFKKQWGVPFYERMLGGQVVYESFAIKAELYSYFETKNRRPSK